MRNSPLAVGLAIIGLAFAASACVPATYTYEQLDRQSQLRQTSFGGPNRLSSGQPYRSSFDQQPYQPDFGQWLLDRQ